MVEDTGVLQAIGECNRGSSGGSEWAGAGKYCAFDRAKTVCSPAATAKHHGRAASRTRADSSRARLARPLVSEGQASWRVVFLFGFFFGFFY
jgi:hypothetical protein